MLKPIALTTASILFAGFALWMYSPASPLTHLPVEKDVTNNTRDHRLLTRSSIEPTTVTLSAPPVRETSNPHVLVLSDSDFVQQVLHSNSPVLVDFYADWCGPCRTMAPVVEEIAKTVSKNFRVGKLDVDANPRATAHFQVDSLPTLLIFKNGEVVDRIIGVTEPSELMTRLKQHA